MESAKMASAIDVRIDDMGSILKFRIGFRFGEISAGFCQSVWLPGSILNFRIRSVSSIGGLIAATLFADTVSDSQKYRPEIPSAFPIPGGATFGATLTSSSGDCYLVSESTSSPS